MTKKIIKAIIELAFLLIFYFAIGIYFPIVLKIKYYYIALSLLTILIFNYNILINMNFDKESKNKSKVNLFNIYYINYMKVYEICMLINNKIKTKEEQLYENQESESNSLDLDGSIIKNNLSATSKISSNNSITKKYERKILQEIKETNSTYLNRIIKYCKSINDKDLKNGSLVKIDNIQLNILNKDEIAKINSMMSGIFKGNMIASEEQNINIDINSIGNILLKDYKYTLKSTIDGNKKLIISIPIKPEKEFENDYSIYDLEIGKVNIIGIYRTDEYNLNNLTNTFTYLQEIGDSTIQSTDNELTKSNTPSKKKRKTDEKKEDVIYIDLIAIIQDLDIKEDTNEE